MKNYLKKSIAAMALGAAVITGFSGMAEAQAPVVGSRLVEQGTPEAEGAAVVYYTKHIDSEHLIKLYNLVNEGITGKVAIKLHTGEKNGPNILPRDMVRDLQETIPDSALVDTNTLYHGDRYTTEGHREAIEVNGWTFCPVDIMDEDGDAVLPVKDGLRLQEVAMGSHILNYDSMLVLTHYKGHAMGGFGGSMKNIGIGNASGQVGKRQVHGVPGEPPADWGQWPAKETLMELMADSAKATCAHFGEHITFINVLRRMSVDCDCAGVAPHEPTIPDIGILASKDILAVDQASCDMVFDMNYNDNKDLVERIMSRHGLHQLKAMSDQKMGSDRYILVSIDED